MKRSRILLAFLVLMSASLVILTPNSVSARPCGKDWFSKVGCTFDPTNPTDNGGILLKRKQIDEAKARLREAGQQFSL